MHFAWSAEVAQLVEHLITDREFAGLNPAVAAIGRKRGWGGGGGKGSNRANLIKLF